ncbi:UDP-N-acetylglucosamine 2-epimerase (non-hydrolyzing) [Rhodopirellula sp. JC740]|uniref:UDP-N-acetylglucosamine 2-epimerase (Non-hydrolyzing) n=1 Tax=Rhodopirellula halodulae TaxID=2894198 RepID=A0ABS8NBI1_9BACT|nr:UDP-N-acetylglucosamine 2-epimerase (non-hydrolyzing) [Rhodopirellula sp. JC740]MCC9640878.1 UDP-N-acetylglucosamine 2-epimerase (non-hydrolyzing) [Rhodopirellula sp. JC740]
MKVLTVVGARPQFVKAGVVSKAFAETGIEECLVHTGQHFDERMSAVFFSELNIPHPKYNLGIHSLGHGAMTGRMLENLEELMIAENPACVVVYGDTNSTLAASLAAAKLHIPIAHVEAGLRSYNRRMPEEVNRVMTDHVSSTLFCSSETGRKNLQAEGISQGVHVVGDVMADASRLARTIVQNDPRYIAKAIPEDLKQATFSLLTLHRAENTDNPTRLSEIVAALNQLTQPVLFPIHPRTLEALDKCRLTLNSNVYCVQPLGYLEMTAALTACQRVITDSGGLQKEAYWAKKLCVTLRDETEWIETVEEGWNQLVVARLESIADACLQCETPETSPDSYGDGHSSVRIAAILKTATN